jgi:glyoxylase-like metal-dependent hydrolase (beta-lactamase superfamily II)
MIEEVTDGIYLVLGANKGRFPWSHSILSTGDINVLFDTGCGAEAIEEVKQDFPIDLVINSHTHPDHFSGNHHFKGYELWVPERFSDILDDLDKMSVRFAGGGEPSRNWLHLVKEVLGHRPTPPTGSYWEGDVIDLGTSRFKALYTPGHTADHFCFLEEDRGILLSFDIDLTPFGPWYGHAECDLDEFRASLRRLKELPLKMVISSHRHPITTGIVKEIAAFDAVFDLRTEKIHRMLEEGPAAPEELAEESPIYGVKERGFALFTYFESRMIEHHLKLLAKRGDIELLEDGRYRIA